MDAVHFDALTRMLSTAGSRRSALAGLLAGALGASVLAAVGLGEAAMAKKVTAQACIPTGKKCPAPKPRGRTGKNRKPKTLGCDRCCQDFVNTSTNQKGKRVRTCACKPNGVTCGTPAHCCSGLCNGGICGAAVVDPLPDTNCVARDGQCTRGGTPCCGADECVSIDEGGRGICRPPCTPGTARCNEQCLPYCELGEPHQSGCNECVCPPETAIFCTLGTGATRPNTCCGANQVCCRQGEIGDPDTIIVCCDQCAETLGTGCAV